MNESNEMKRPFANPPQEIHHAIALWAADCAERSLNVFAEGSPTDERPRLALDAVRSWVAGQRKMTECREAAFAAHAAAREATSPAATAAARACGQACAAAHMWNHAPHAADYAARAIKLSHSDKAEAAEAEANERAWQRRHLSEDLHPLVFNGQVQW